MSFLSVGVFQSNKQIPYQFFFDIFQSINRQIISVGFKVLPSPVGLAIFEEYAYATDDTRQGIIKLHRFDRNPEGSEVIHSTSSAIRKLRVVHPALQPVGEFFKFWFSFIYLFFSGWWYIPSHVECSWYSGINNDNLDTVSLSKPAADVESCAARLK